METLILISITISLIFIFHIIYKLIIFIFGSLGNLITSKNFGWMLQIIAFIFLLIMMIK